MKQFLYRIETFGKSTGGKIKAFVQKGALAEQGGQDLIEYVAIGGLILLAIIVAINIIRNTVISKAGEINW